MPQAPLPAPAARLSSVPIFQPLNPGTYMDRQPFNVLPYMKYPDMIDHAVKGVQLASMIGKLPREAQENAAQGAMASIAKEQSTAIQARIKAIQQDKTKSPDEKTAAIQDLLLQSGFGYAPSGGTIDPLGGVIRGQQYQAGQQEIGIRQMANPNLPNVGNPARPVAPVQKQPVQQQPAPEATIPAKPDLHAVPVGMVPQATGTQLASSTPPAATFLQNAVYDPRSEWWNQVSGGVPMAPINQGGTVYG